MITVIAADAESRLVDRHGERRAFVGGGRCAQIWGLCAGNARHKEVRRGAEKAEDAEVGMGEGNRE